MSKWNKQYWEDLAERVGTTAIGGGITVLTTDTSFHYSTAAVISVIAIPTAVSLLKGLLANLVGGSNTGTASAVGVTSNQSSAAMGAAGENQ